MIVAERLRLRGRSLLCVSLLIIAILGAFIWISPFKAPVTPEEEVEKKAQEPTKTEKQEVPVTLDDYNWSIGIPSWKVLNYTAEGLKRIKIDFLKGAVSAGLYTPNPNQPVNETLIKENLLMKKKLNATVYAVRFILQYKNGEFYAPGAEEPKIDDYLRSIMTDCLMAKKAGLAVLLEASFIPEGLENLKDLREALDKWQTVIGKLAEISERYKFEFFAPLSGFDRLLRVECGLKLPEDKIAAIINEYYPRYTALIRQIFKGKIIAHLRNAHPDLSGSISAYNLSCFDLIGITIGSSIASFDEERFQNDFFAIANMMRDLCEEWSNRWYIGEVLFYDKRPITEEKLEGQSRCYDVLLNAVRRIDPSTYRGPDGIIIGSWNLRVEGVFAEVMNRPAEAIIREFFSSPRLKTAKREVVEVMMYPNATPAIIPERMWADMGVPSGAEREAYFTTASVGEVSEWYRGRIAGWTLVDENLFSEETEGFKVQTFLLKREDQGLYIFIVKNPHIPVKKTIIGMARGSWSLIKTCRPTMMREAREEERLVQVEPPFTYLPELGNGSVIFTVSPVDLDAIDYIEPLGRMNAPTGHVIPSEHGGFNLKDPSRKYPLRAPADGIIFEILYNPKYEDYQVRIAHSNTFVSIFGHLTGLSEKIKEALKKASKVYEDSYQVKIPVKAGEVIGTVGGHPERVVGFDWGVYDKNVTNKFINLKRYNGKFKHGTHFLPYCEESLRKEYLKRIPRKAEPRMGCFCYDKPGKLVGNWMLEEFKDKDPDAYWNAALSFAYDLFDPSRILIGIGGYIIEKPATYLVHGNTPDPADINKSYGAVIYYLEPYDTNPEAPRITLLVQMISEEKIKVEAFNGWVKNPRFTDKARYYTR